MATLTKLLKDEMLIQLSVELEPGEVPWRRMYGTAEFVDWLNNVLPNLNSTVIGGEISPLEQVDAVFHDFIVGGDFDDDRRFKKLSRTPDLFVWEFKSLDIRIFGWFSEKDTFICTFGDAKDEIELKRSYGTYIAKTSYTRAQLGFGEEQYLKEKDYVKVLSNKS